MQDLEAILGRIDGRGYKAYKDLQGRYFTFDHFELKAEHIQGDPYAAPSRFRALIRAEVAALPESAIRTPARHRATRDFIARVFRSAARDRRDLRIDAGRQTVLDRSACLINHGNVELRFTVDLPGAGRRILGRRATDLLTRVLPEVISRAAMASNLDLAALEAHVATVEDQEALRASLTEAGLVAFVGNGASLPRRSGVDDRPLENAVAFSSPPSLEVALEAPNGGRVLGLGIPKGITLVVGGGFHGKSTLLRALESGIWDHVPGDGRELVVADANAVKIRAEDGRSVSSVDISSFIAGLPGGQTTTDFTTELASGSTSQAAALVEALESGASALLLDEDTSATNFMIRDRRMQELVAKTSEPITPFVDRIRELRDVAGVSTVLVMGGSGDYFDHADLVLQMDGYRPVDVTADARSVASSHATFRVEEHEQPFVRPSVRRLRPSSLDPEKRRGRWKIQTRGMDTLLFGPTDIDVRAVEQLEDPSQLRAIGWILGRISEEPSDEIEPHPLTDGMIERLQGGDWDWLTGRPDGDLAIPRRHEVLAALNRLRGAHFVRPPKSGS